MDAQRAREGVPDVLRRVILSPCIGVGAALLRLRAAGLLEAEAGLRDHRFCQIVDLQLR
jgi:hypothetical protein